MNRYGNWKKSATDINSDAWSEAVEEVSDTLSSADRQEMVQALANADGVLFWISGAVEVPAYHVNKFRDLVKIASRMNDEVERQAKEYPDARE